MLCVFLQGSLNTRWKPPRRLKKTHMFSAVMTRLTWRYRDRELITASSFKFLKAGNMSWTLGLDSKSLKQNHSRTSLLTLNNGNSIHVYFRYEFYSHFASYTKQSLSNTHNKTHLHSCKSPSSSSVELSYHEGSPRTFAFESKFAQNNDPIGKKTGKTRKLMVSRLRTKRPEKAFLLSIKLLIVFYFSGSSLKPGARFLATCSSTALVKT